MNLDKQNSRKHSDRNKAAIRKSLETARPARSIVIDSGDNVLAGNGVAEQAEALGIPVQIVESDGTHLIAVKRVDVAPDSPEARRIATLDNLVADTSAFEYDAERLKAALANDLVSKAIAEQDERLRKLLKVDKPESVDAGELVDKAAQLQEKWQVKRGDLWQCGKHRILCGDSTNAEDVTRLMQGEKAQGIFTSPPYAEQRKEHYGGIAADKYVEWFDAIQTNARQILENDGSFFVNIKPHCEDGERVLYVFDLVLAMRRKWQWRFVDDFVWVKNGFPGGWNNRFRDRHESIFHFCINPEIKFRPQNVSTESDDVFDYAPENTANKAGSNKQILAGVKEFKRGLARPANVLQIAANREQLGQAAMFPVALPEFFIKAFSDEGDIWFELFLGSGTTLIAAEQTGRIGRGVEIEPKYVAVSLERLANLGLTCERIEAA